MLLLKLRICKTTQSLKLENRGSIPAVLFVDLERHPEFTVEMDPNQVKRQMGGNKTDLLSRLPGTIAEDGANAGEHKAGEGGGADDAGDGGEGEEDTVCSLIPVTDIRVGLTTASTKAPNTARDTASAATSKRKRCFKSSSTWKSGAWRRKTPLKRRASRPLVFQIRSSRMDTRRTSCA